MTSIRSYLELLRPANVTTALADVMAGYAVAGLANPRALPWLLVSTACLYGGGVVLNDVFDREVDRIERPERPIPSGRVQPQAAAILGGSLLGAGVLSATQATHAAALIAVLIAAFVLLYDAWGKRQNLIGPINMGTCRALNLMLGIAAVPTVLSQTWFLPLIPFIYIVAVTALSRGEVLGGHRGIAAFALVSLSFVLIALLALAVGPGPGPGTPAALALTLLLAWRLLPAFWQAYRTPGAGPIRRAIKTGVLSLVLVDAVIGAAYAGPLYALVILATAVVAGLLSRVFAVT
jgi:4-hydroxybenzoate polyprenyltransferase